VHGDAAPVLAGRRANPAAARALRFSSPRSEQPLPSFRVDDAVALAGPAWLRKLRTAAAETFLAEPLPTDALEEWRYSRIDTLDPDSYLPAPRPDRSDEQPRVGEPANFVAALGGVTFATLNGYASGALTAAPGVTVDVLSAEGTKDPGFEDLVGEGDAFAKLNLALAPDPLRIRIAGTPADPIVLVHRTTGRDLAVFPRVRIELDEGSEAVVVEVVEGPGANLVVPVTEIDLAAGAQLSYLHSQLLGPEAWQIALQSSRVGSASRLTSAAASLGGSYARLKTASTLAGERADSRLLALYFGSGSQMHDFRTVQRHAAGRTRSDLLYKGVVANSSRSVYSGLIRVEKGAAGSNAFQTNRNLVLHEGAHADSVPNLEIEDNDVRCSHASAVGPVSEDQRFYLEARGVPPRVAERLIALGFLDEVIDELTPSSVYDPLRSMIASKLAAAEDAERARDDGGSGAGNPDE
jgi:Fe-S cluster assembly protein SufD